MYMYACIFIAASSISNILNGQARHNPHTQLHHIVDDNKERALLCLAYHLGHVFVIYLNIYIWYCSHFLLEQTVIDSAISGP